MRNGLGRLFCAQGETVIQRGRDSPVSLNAWQRLEQYLEQIGTYL